MPETLKPGAVIFAKDVAKVAAFYRGVLGMAVTHESKDATVIESPNVQLVIHPIPATIARAIVVESPPKRREDTAVKLVFPVGDLAEARRVAAELGGELNPAKKEWEARGFRACDGHDPEGNVFQLRVKAS